MGEDVPGGPVVVPLVVHGKSVPEGHLVVEVHLVGVGEGAHVEKERVFVRRAVVQALAGLGGGLGTGPAEAGVEVEGVGEEKGPVVVEVVAGHPLAWGEVATTAGWAPMVPIQV